jgi:hypothetical protein
MQDLTALTFDDVSATKSNDDSERDLDGVSVSRWTDHGQDRVYINGLFTSTTDVYVDLKNEAVTVSGTKVRTTSVDRDGDELAVTIKRPSWTYDITVTQADGDGEATETAADESDDEDSDVDLERFGVDI